MSRTSRLCGFYLLSALGLVAAASAGRAQHPCNVDAGFHFNMQSGGCQPTLAPWYSYFPYEAHFQVSAPVCTYPNWPVPFPPAKGAPANPGQAAPAPNRMGQAPMYPGWQWPNMQTVGYPGGYPYGTPMPMYGR